jgi:pimeloyl-ACP methyl ester carboxylesterase
VAKREEPRASSDTAIVPFKINVPEEVLTDLKARLRRTTRFPDEPKGVGWEYGADLAYMKELVAYWRDKYDWRAQERRLNEFPQFKTRIDGLDIHFIHQRSKNPNAIPLLLLNGYPSSIDEYSKVIKPLTDPEAYGGRAEDAFHVIVPSMPGYGFSDKARGRGFHPGRVAQLYAQLMARLGYTQYISQGTDWGWFVTIRLGLQDKAHVRGIHLADCPATPTPDVPLRQAGWGGPAGHMEVLGLRPQTIGYGLADSPVELAAWLVHKYYLWPDNDNNIEKRFTKDELLTNIMLYWVTNSGSSSGRMYYEGLRTKGELGADLLRSLAPKLPEERVTVPTGCAAYTGRSRVRRTSNSAEARDPEMRKQIERRYNVVQKLR